MTFNTALFKKIHDIIKVDPRGKFDMSSWESNCGTTRCLAGWAIYDATGQPLFQVDGWSLSQSVVGLAAEFGVDADIPDVGAHLLGLTEEEANIAFHVDDEVALAFIKAAAEGRDNDARGILDGEDW